MPTGMKKILSSNPDITHISVWHWEHILLNSFNFDIPILWDHYKEYMREQSAVLNLTSRTEDTHNYILALMLLLHMSRNISSSV